VACCCSPNYSIPERWQTWKDRVSASHRALNLGKIICKTLKMLKIACGEQTMIMTQASEWLSKFTNMWLLLQIPNTLDIQWVKQMKAGYSAGTCPQKQQNHYMWSANMLGFSSVSVQRISQANENIQWQATNFMFHTCSVCDILP